MKNFLIMLSEKQPHLMNKNLLDAHINFLKKLYADGYLSICGPFTDNEGALLIIKADSKDHAKEIINQDPFIIAQYYRKFIIHEFMAANDENNWLAVTESH